MHVRFFSTFCALFTALTFSPATLLPVRAADGPVLAVAAASDLVFCLEKLNAEFLKANPGVDLKVSTGASGNFFAQIQNGAPFDVFLSADVAYPQGLIKAGLAEERSLTRYAVGHLVLWTMRPEKVDVSRGLEALRAPGVGKIAIANPEHAPYGRAAKAALEKTGVYEAVRERLVLGENIAQTAQFVQSGNVDAGIVALSLVLAPKVAGQGRYYEIPESSYPPLEQALIITKRGAANPLAAKYVEFLRSQEARAIFDAFGFRLPAETVAPGDSARP